MDRSHWAGVFPAITTPFGGDGAVDHDALGRHVRWLLDAGCNGIVPLGSLGEGATLTTDEKLAILRTCRAASAGRAPLIPGVSGLATAACVDLARDAADIGCDALMVLPPYVYPGDDRETGAHFDAVIAATPLPCMIYNNPIAYGVDLGPERIRALADRHPNVRAVKESSGDVRRITALREVLGDRLALFAGLDDMVVEALAMGADGWVAGLVNALPEASVRLFDLAAARRDEAADLYRRFLPLLRMDIVPKFVQLIKLVQAEVGRGSPRVRPPRLELAGAELDRALATIRASLEALRDAPAPPA